ncbi:carbohydrate kinase [Phyllobacterium salinisoli]|uniref:Carbohydrate kinase n=2 Tax=Phyllobacterium salinisoli TaxID=1899321 RepID=A0A368JXF3_9HYPH|nr:FGGY-family carbohydrate kinase [Phyllobacterium salinisoli]RCS21827.1 carbohydrate kinase [Phyllobacterium salinisoli]
MQSERAIAVGIDLGTSGARAAALSQTGEVVGFAAVHFTDPAEMKSPAAWRNRVEECLTALSQCTSLANVEGLAVDGTSGTVLSVDGQGRPLGGVLMYNDPCPDAAIVERIAAVAPAESPARGANSGLARAIHLLKRSPDAKLLHQADWIAMQLGVTEAVSDENNALKTGYDLTSERWPEWIREAGMPIERLPAVHRAGEPIGVVGTTGRAFGLPESCRIHAGTTDGCASFLATGAGSVGDAVTALGSTLVLKLACEHPINASEYGIYAHRVLGFWLVGGSSNTGGAVIRTLIGDHRLEDLTARMRPDCPTNLDYYPLLKPGERFPINDPAYPPRLFPRPDDDAVFFQAILEGMTAIEMLGYKRLHALGAPKLKTVRTVGGGARNPVWSLMRQSALGVDCPSARSMEAAVGAASLVLARRAA